MGPVVAWPEHELAAEQDFTGAAFRIGWREFIPLEVYSHDGSADLPAFCGVGKDIRTKGQLGGLLQGPTAFQDIDAPAVTHRDGSDNPAAGSEPSPRGRFAIALVKQDPSAFGRYPVFDQADA